jgi:hypothetical protein
MVRERQQGEITTMENERSRLEGKLKNWWANGDQKHPCLLITLPPEKEDAGKIPDTDDLTAFWTDGDFRISRSLAIARYSRYFGQAIPFHWVDYVASTMEIVLGCTPQFLDKESVWAHPRLKCVEEVTDIRLDFQNPYYRILRDMNAKLAVSVPMQDPIAFFALEGISDSVSGLYGAENFLLDLLLKPAAVKQAMEHIKRLWIEAFEDFKKILYKGRPKENGCSWAGIWAPGTTFPLQEDLTYMISPEMFREFCLPHIIDIAAVLDYPLYHLDGIGAIPHLDAILTVDPIRAIQWVPGAGKEPIAQWYELIKKVIDRGKSIQVFAEPHEIADLTAAVGSNRLLITVTGCTREQAEDLLNTYGEN